MSFISRAARVLAAFIITTAAVSGATTATAAGGGPDTERIDFVVWFASGPWPGTVGEIQSPGTPRLMVEMNLRSTGTYTNVHFKTSHPGSAAGCSMAQLTTTRGTACPVRLPALRNGESLKYTVTLTGERNRVPFTLTRSYWLRAATVTTQVTVNGQDATGKRFTITRGQPVAVRYTLTNQSTVPLTDLKFHTGDSTWAPRCVIGSLPAGSTRSCTFTLTPKSGELAPLYGGGVAEEKFPGMTASGPEGWRAYLVPDVRTSLTFDPGTSPQAPPADTASSQAPSTETVTPPLAETGLPVGDTVAVAAGLIGLGCGARRLARR